MLKIFCSLLIFFTLFTFSFLYAQRNVTGKIADASGKPVSSASIILKYTKEGNPQTKYTLVKADGTYSISLVEGALKPGLQCIALGFQSQYIDLDSIRTDYNFVLQPSVIKLDPVNITAKQTVRVKDDTTTFLVEKFSKKNEQTVEDLIKRLPGMSVDKDGNIKYNGRQVERVLVEDGDLFEKDFKMLTKNLSADMVEKIQAIDNYNDNPLLSGLTKTDKQVLNLKLKKDKLLNVNGNVNLNAGLPKDKYEGKVNLISISPNLKGILLGAGNNVGINPFSMLNIAEPVANQRRFNLEDNIVLQANNRLVEIPYLYYQGIDLNRNNFNDTKIASGNFMFRPLKKLEVKLAAYFLNDNNRQQLYNDTRFAIDNQPPVVFNEVNNLNKQQLYQAYNLTLTYRPNKRQQFKYVGKFSFNSLDQQNEVRLATGPLYQNLAENGYSTEQRLEFTDRLADETAIVVEVLYNNRNNKQYLGINPSNYMGFLPEGMTGDRDIYQDSKFPLRQFSGNARVFGQGIWTSFNF